MSKDREIKGDLFEPGVIQALDEEFKKNQKRHLVTERALERVSQKATSEVPSRLTRTALFTPKVKNFNTDSNYNRMFKVDKYSTIHATGRELGVYHRDLCYALFKLNPTPYEAPNPFYDPRDPNCIENENETRYRLITSWREVLASMNLTVHRNNVNTILQHISDMQKVVITVLDGSPEDIIEKFEKGDVPKGHMSNVIHGISWDEFSSKNGYDAKIVVEFGRYTNQAFEHKQLASINMNIQLGLKQGYSKTIWPFINSHLDRRKFITEETIGQLVSFDFENETTANKKEFRRKCKQAFEEMQQQGGIESYKIESVKKGRFTFKRYFYKLALKNMQLVLPGFEDAE